MKIPQSSPFDGYRKRQIEIQEAIHRVLDSGWYILGKEVENFEQEFALYSGSLHCIGVANGTDAIVAVLKSLGVGPGHGVLTVSHTAVATIAAIELTGAQPIYLDINLKDYTIDVNQVELFLNKYGKNFKGLKVCTIIPVHLYGNPCALDQLRLIAEKFGITVIEDCAQAQGATLQGQKVGNFGVAGTFSFYPTKNLGALGDGGAIITNDSSLAEKLYSIRQYGWRTRYISDITGLNSRLDEVQAAILRIKLKFLDEDNQTRIKIAKRYSSEINNELIILPEEIHGCNPVFHQYVIRAQHRNKFIDYLNSFQISTALHYPLPVHMQPAYQDNALIPFSLSVTENISNKILSLPMFPELSEEMVSEVIFRINQFSL